MVDRAFCERYQVCPDTENGNIIGFFVGEKSDLAILSYLKFLRRGQYRITSIGTDELLERMQVHFGDQSSFSSTSGRDKSEDSTPGKSHSIIKLINEIIQKGISREVSDIHFEPFERNMVCRFRINGILRRDREIPREATSEVLARIKIMADLDISERRRPQDGRIRFTADDKTVDIRVSILPTDFGEKAVLRILDKTRLRLDLDLLGLSEKHKQLLEEKIVLPNGMVLVTGPTGSGKTTTLYAILNSLRSPGVNITTIEDPIEYNLEGVNQTQIKPEINLTFANSLRAILRQDPNIIMVGEIRDRETLDQALRAALTGHLVLSTLHTNDAFATIIRMLDLGAENFLLGSTLKLIVAQRLVQTICPQCKDDKCPPEFDVASRKLGLDSGIKLFYGQGCDACANTGFAGRTAIYEMLTVDAAMANLISINQPESDLRSQAAENGFCGLKQAGIEKITQGITTPIEVLRAVMG